MANPTYLLAFDQGTTSSRSILFTAKGQMVATAQKEFEQIYPRPGWVEHDPMEIWASQNSTALEVLSRSGIKPAGIAAVGLTNQRETTVVWDRKTGKPVYNAIVWQDRRTADRCAKMKDDGMEEAVTRKTGLRLDPYFSATKLRWILDHVAGAAQRAADGHLLFGTVDSWLLWQLTGGRVHATDITNASRTLLMNLETGQWDPELLDLFGIPEAMLPEIRTCSEVYGSIDASLFPAGVSVAGVAGDQHAALFGQTCFTSGMAKNTYGTGCFLLLNTGETRVSSRNNLLSTVAWKIGDRTEYALEGSVFIGGAAVQWVRDELQMVRSAAELDALAATVEDANGLFLVPAFSGLGAPYWDPYARGTAVGITRGTNRAHFCRAVLESIAFQSADLLAAMEADSGLSLRELRVDGGGSRSDPLLQIQADLLQSPVIRPHCVETTALGAAYLAGLAAGCWENRGELVENWRMDRKFEPTADPGQVQEQREGWKRAVERSRNWELPAKGSTAS